MRVICPRCGAQYEIDAAAIPAAGREVECSACGHVWRQPGQGAPFDAAARPTLHRPLNESILSVLREEAARELDARAAERAAAPAPAPARDPDSHAAEDIPADAPGDNDWADPRLSHLPKAPPSAGILAELIHEAPPVPAPGEVLPSRRVLPLTDYGTREAFAGPSPQRPPRSAAELPPAAVPAERAASDAPATAMTGTTADPVPAPFASSMSSPESPTAPVPTPVPTPQQDAARAYRVGFTFALMLAVLAALTYFLAPRLADTEPIGDWLSAWQALVDHARHRLHDLIAPDG